MKIENKSVLLICRENTTYVMLELAKKLLKNKNDVSLFFVSSFESYYNKCQHNKSTYYRAMETGFKVYDLKDITIKFYEDIKKKKYEIDKDFFKEFEKDIEKYNLTLRLALLSEQNLCKEYHNRFQNNNIENKELLYWSELVIKNVYRILKEAKPDIILDLENVTLSRVGILNYSKKNKIPYITIDYPRFEDYLIPTFNLGLSNETFIIKEYEKVLKEGNLEKELKEIAEYRRKKEILPDKFKGTITDYKISFKKSLKIIISSILREFNIEIKNGNLRKKNFKLNLPLFENPFKKIIFHFFYEIKKIISWYNLHKYFENPIDGEEYIYYPLHLIPESTTFMKAPFYIDELSMIKNISKALPYNYQLYIKEHQAMSGERPFSFYKELKKLKNIRIIKLNYYSDPKKIIEESKGVITIAGSTALEANLLEKPVVVFGYVPYVNIKDIKVVGDIKDLVKNIQAFPSYKKDELKTAAYIKLIKIVGENIKLSKLIASLERKYIKNKEECLKLESEIDKLYKLYEKGVYFYEKYRNE